MLKQGERVKNGITKSAGNYIVIQSKDLNTFICIVHLKKNTVVLKKGQSVKVGDKIGECGNSGNSIQPHIHIQAMNSLNLMSKNGIPLYFKDYYELSNNYKFITNPTFLKLKNIVSDSIVKTITLLKNNLLNCFYIFDSILFII